MDADEITEELSSNPGTTERRPGQLAGPAVEGEDARAGPDVGQEQPEEYEFVQLQP